nr:reverse transcriptase domain-containing protein [Tanacetum cinerariifolium]
TPSDDPIVSTTSPTLTPFGDRDFLLFEEAKAFLGLKDDPDSPELDPSYYDPKGDIQMLEAILNSDPAPSLPNHEQSVPSFTNELKACEAKTIKYSVDESPEVELKDLPPHLEYAFLEGDNKLPVIIAKELGEEEKAALIKLIICYLGHKHDIHRRPESPYHVTGDDFLLENLKFAPKGENDEVFGMAIPKDLITEAIQNSEYYDKYVEMVGKKKAQKDDVPKQASKSKNPTPAKKPAPVKKPVPTKEKASKPSPSKKAHKDEDELNLQRGIQMSLEAFDSHGHAMQAPVGGVVIREYASVIPRPILEVQGKGKGIVVDELAAQSLLELQKSKKRNAKTGADMDRSNNPEPVHEDFIATMYPKVHKTLKLVTEEQVFLENPPSSSETLSSMKNLDDVFTFGDQFIEDKSLEDEPRKATMDTEVESMVTVPIHQASSSAPQLSTPVIDLKTLKPVSPPTPAPMITSTTATTTTLPLPPPPPLQQGSPDSGLAARVSALEKRYAEVEQKNKTLENKTQNLGFRVFVLELRDLPHKIDQTVNEVVIETVKTTLQAPLRESFRDMFKADMKEIPHQQMFENGSYKAHPDHANLFQALEVSMNQDNMDELTEATTKSRKRRRDDKDPHPPTPKDSGQTRRKGTNLMHLPQPAEDVLTPDDMNRSDIEDTEFAHIPKIKTRPDWLRPVPEEEDQKRLNRTRQFLRMTYQNLRTTGPLHFPKHIKLQKRTSYVERQEIWDPSSHGIADVLERRSSAKLIWKVDLVNPEGHQVVPDVSKPLPLGGPPSQVAIQAEYFFNKDLEYLVSGNKERSHGLSISKLKAANYLDFGLEELVPNLVIRKRVEDLQLEIKSYQTKLNLTQPNWDASGFLFKEDYTIVHKPRSVIYRDKNEQKKMTRIWSEDDRRRSKEFMEAIEIRLKIRRIFMSLESFVGGRLRDVDYRSITRTT